MLVFLNLAIMYKILLLIFVILPIVEIWLLINVGGWIGAPLTILAIIATAIIGVAWLRFQGFSTLNRFNQRLAGGQLPTAELVEGVLLVVAGAFLLTPGFATDSVGFALLVSPIRQTLASWLLKFVFVDRIRASGFSGVFTGSRQAGQESANGNDPVVIEGEFEREHDRHEDAK